MYNLFLDPHDFFMEDLFVLVEFFGANKIELFFDFIMIQYEVEFFGFLLLIKIGVFLFVVG